MVSVLAVRNLLKRQHEQQAIEDYILPIDTEHYIFLIDIEHYIFLIDIEHRFPNWGTRTPRGTQSGSGGTRGENLICVFKVKKPITFSNGAIHRHEILNSPNSQVTLS